MTNITPAAAPARAARILHGALPIGLITVGGVFFWLLQRVGPLTAVPGVGLGLAGVALVILIVALGFLRGRVPERRSDQSSDDYWSSNDARGPAIMLWAVIESAGILSLMGYVLSGHVAAAGSAILAIIALVLVRPARLEGAD